MTDLFLDHKIDMYGICRRINGLVDFQPFARAIRDLSTKSWEVQIINVDGTVEELEVPIGGSADDAVEAVGALIRLCYRRNYAPKREKVQARALQKGDRVGSGEIIKWVGVGVRTPRGKVEVVLAKSGNADRLAIWNASTLITVHREAV